MVGGARAVLCGSNGEKTASSLFSTLIHIFNHPIPPALSAGNAFENLEPRQLFNFRA